MTQEKLEQQFIKEWQTIGISNDFVFCKIMQDEELLAELVRMILPDLEFTKLEVQSQKTIELGMDIHGVRFDIFAVSESGKVIEVEMQVLNKGDLPKRIRFYGSINDTQLLEKGVLYKELKESYIIMICPFDYYKKGRHIYTFTNRCRENHELEMGDGTTKIVLSSEGTLEDVSGKLKAFLDYVSGQVSEDAYVKKLEQAVQKARANKKWRREYMTLYMRDLENQEIGYEAGRREGHEAGRCEERMEQIAEMLRDGKTPQEIVDFCKYPMQLVEDVQKNLLITE